MLCQQCHKRDASVHFTQIINGNKAVMYLCNQCAEKKGQFVISPKLNLGDFLWGFHGLGQSEGFAKVEKPDEVCCDVCSMSIEDFRKTGKLGCANCYRVFNDSLNPILRRLHGSVQHTGRVPKKAADCIREMNELEGLKAQLTEAIGKEEYEKAAVLRDSIRDLENGGKEDKADNVSETDRTNKADEGKQCGGII